MVAGEIRRRVQKKFKLRGFTLKVEALQEALSFLSHFPDAEDEALDLLLDEIDKSPVFLILSFYLVFDTFSSFSDS